MLDGTGGPACDAVVAARGSEPVAIGRLEESAAKTIDASGLGLTRQGRIAPGMAADLVVFDRDTGTFESPHSYASGIPHVAVYRMPVVQNGEYIEATPGMTIGDFWD